jgi:Ca-activated chloride channel family protein
MSRSRRPLWLYPIFQVPLVLFGIFLVLAALFWLLGLGRPSVAVVIALDLSSSTYQNQPFNAPGSILSQEVAAVQSYLQENSKLRNPNQVMVLGFRSAKVPKLTNSFATDSQKVQAELAQALQKIAMPLSQLPEPEIDDLNDTILKGINALSEVSNHCKQLLLVSDDGVKLTPGAIISEALKHRIRINAIGFNGNVPDLQSTALATGGLYISGEASNLETLFLGKLFPRFNSNLNWIVLWLGAAWVALMWLLALPLDRLIFQYLMKYHWSLAGRLALGNALFWSVVTPMILWRLWQILGFPFFSSC